MDEQGNRRMQRIAFIAGEDVSNWDRWSIYQLSIFLQQKGDEVHLFPQSFKDFCKDPVQNLAGITAPFPKPLSWRKWLQSLDVFSLRKIIKSPSPYFHIHLWGSVAIKIVNQLLRFGSSDSTFFLSFLSGSEERPNFQKVDVRRLLLRSYGLIHEISDQKIYQQYGLKTDRIRTLPMPFASRFVASKPISTQQMAFGHREVSSPMGNPNEIVGAQEKAISLLDQLTPHFKTQNKVLHKQLRWIVVCGELNHLASYRALIWSFDILRYIFPEIGLAVIGDGPYRDELQQFAIDLSCEDQRILFTGPVPDLRIWLKMASIIWIANFNRDSLGFFQESLTTAKMVFIPESIDTELATGISGDLPMVCSYKMNLPIDLAEKTRAILAQNLEVDQLQNSFSGRIDRIEQKRESIFAEYHSLYHRENKI